MFFRAAKSARPWSSPEPLKNGLFCLPLFDKFCRPAGGVTGAAARPVRPAGLPARRQGARGALQRSFDSQKLVLSDPDLIISTTNERTNLVSTSRAVGTGRGRGTLRDFERNNSKPFSFNRPWIFTCPHPGFSELPTVLGTTTNIYAGIIMPLEPVGQGGDPPCKFCKE